MADPSYLAMKPEIVEFNISVVIAHFDKRSDDEWQNNAAISLATRRAARAPREYLRRPAYSELDMAKLTARQLKV